MTFEEVYERFKGPVWRLALRLTGSDEEALDASQEIFLRIWRGLPRFRGEAKLSTWVFQVAWNHLRAVRRRSQRQERGLGRRAPIDGGSAEIEDPGADPERSAAGRERLERVRQALGGLPEHQLAVLWLRDGEDLGYEEIAVVLDIPVGTVRSRLARARMALRRSVEE